MNHSILITGASGFIGSFLVEEAVRRGFDTWAGVRATSSRAYLQDPRIRFLELDFGRPDVLRRQLAAHGRFDYIVHCAGVSSSSSARLVSSAPCTSRTTDPSWKATCLVPIQPTGAAS